MWRRSCWLTSIASWPRCFLFASIRDQNLLETTACSASRLCILPTKTLKSSEKYNPMHSQRTDLGAGGVKLMLRLAVASFVFFSSTFPFGIGRLTPKDLILLSILFTGCTSPLDSSVYRVSQKACQHFDCSFTYQKLYQIRRISSELLLCFVPMSY